MQISSFIPGGAALTTFSDPSSPNHGKKLFLWNALPDEIVESFEITKKKPSYLEGIATKIKNPSPYRTEPKDTCYLSTSPWQILTYPFELEQKRLLVLESLKQAHLDLTELNRRNINVEPVKTDGNEWHYRNKMEYSLYWDNDDKKIYLAFHARGSHRKIPLFKSASGEVRLTAEGPELRRGVARNTRDGGLARRASAEGVRAQANNRTNTSSLERPEIAEKALKIVQELNSRGESARKYQSLLLRSSQQGIVSGGLLEKFQPHPTFENLSDAILGKTYSYSPNGFFQINLPVYELALQEIQQHIKTDRILDLYSGVGSIGLSVFDPSKHSSLTLVESNPAAFRELKNNLFTASLNATHQQPQQAQTANQPNFPSSEKDVIGRGPYRAILARSEDCLSYIKPSQTVILDPPRAGCDKKLLEKLLEITPESIIYLSCNPSTQARDVKILTETKKYKITKISPYNFFPKTPHIENLIILNHI